MVRAAGPCPGRGGPRPWSRSTRRRWPSPPRWWAGCTRPGRRASPSSSRWRSTRRRSATPATWDDEPWTLGPWFEPWFDRLHFLVWANTYDARDGEPVWWWGRKAARLGAGARRPDGPADVAAGRRPAGVGRRRPAGAARDPSTARAVVHATRSSSARLALVPAAVGRRPPTWRPTSWPPSPTAPARPGSSPPPARARPGCSPSASATCTVDRGLRAGDRAGRGLQQAGPAGDGGPHRRTSGPGSRRSTRSATGSWPRPRAARRRCSTSARCAGWSRSWSRPAARRANTDPHRALPRGALARPARACATRPRSRPSGTTSPAWPTPSTRSASGSPRMGAVDFDEQIYAAVEAPAARRRAPAPVPRPAAATCSSTSSRTSRRPTCCCSGCWPRRASTCSASATTTRSSTATPAPTPPSSSTSPRCSPAPPTTRSRSTTAARSRSSTAPARCSATTTAGSPRRSDAGPRPTPTPARCGSCEHRPEDGGDRAGRDGRAAWLAEPGVEPAYDRRARPGQLAAPRAPRRAGRGRRPGRLGAAARRARAHRRARRARLPAHRRPARRLRPATTSSRSSAGRPRGFPQWFPKWLRGAARRSTGCAAHRRPARRRQGGRQGRCASPTTCAS